MHPDALATGVDQADFAIIVAPKSMIAEWPRDFARFKGDLYKVVVGMKKDLERATKIWRI